jgi:hypothetical protein
MAETPGGNHQELSRPWPEWVLLFPRVAYSGWNFKLQKESGYTKEKSMSAHVAETRTAHLIFIGQRTFMTVSEDIKIGVC